MSETRGIGIPLKRVQPIHRGTHDATKAYETLDIVVNASNTAAYMAVQDVPVGTALTDANYWEAIVNVSGVVDNVNSAVNANKEELQNNIDTNKKETDEAISQLSEEISDETAKQNAAITQERNRAIARENEIEELFTAPTEEAVAKWLDEHPEATTTVQDKSLTIEKMVVGALGYVTPEMFGAKGDGVTDDTQAFVDAICHNVCIVCNGTYLLSSDNHKHIYDDLRIVGVGTILYDFHFSTHGNVFVEGMTLINTNNVATGLFNNLGKMIMRNCKFDGTRCEGLGGGVCNGDNGYLSLNNCTFVQSAVNILGNSVTDIIGCNFNANSANDLTHLSNECIHVQSSDAVLIRGCVFENSKQDYIDLYPKSKNVTVENCTFNNIETVAFEIKVVVRDSGDSLCGDIDNITFRNNHFRNVTSTIFSIGLNGDLRSDTSTDPGCYAKNISINNNVFDVKQNSLNLMSITNAKNISIKENVIDAGEYSVGLCTTGKIGNYNVGYELRNENVVLARNIFKNCAGATIFSMHMPTDVEISHNIVLKHSGMEVYLLSGTHYENSDVSIMSNRIDGDDNYRIAMLAKPLDCSKLVVRKQTWKKCYVGAIDKAVFTDIDFTDAPMIECYGDVKTLILDGCKDPTVTSANNIANLLMINNQLKQTVTIQGVNVITITNLLQSCNVGELKTSQNVTILNDQ